MDSASVSRFVHTETRSSNTIKKTVFLQEWWLVKAEKPVGGKVVAVAGIHCRVKNQAMRQFSSAPILRARDIFDLETTDGVCVMLEGVINQTRTLQNGFTSDIFEHFIFGFPPQWESFSKKCMVEEYSTNLFSKENDNLTAEITSIIPKKSKEGAEKPSICIEASASKTRAKRVLSYESPDAKENEITRTKQRTCKFKVSLDTENTPSGSKVAAKKTINSGKKSSISRKNTVEETPTRQVILSPESVSTKRTRSGRLILPTLEFWRNQTALYDEDRNIIGIKQDPPSDQPSRGCKSKPMMKRKRA